jgi:hypothetical protein
MRRFFAIAKGLGFGQCFLGAISELSGDRYHLKIRHLRPIPQ